MLCTVSAAGADRQGRAATGFSEQAWMMRGGRIAVLVTDFDPARGFDSISLEIRALRGKLKGTHTRRAAPAGPLLRPQRLRWLSQHGEYELFRAELARARRAVEERLLADGWTELGQVRLTWSSHDSGVGRVASRHASLQVPCRTERRGAFSELIANPIGVPGKKVLLVRVPVARIELSHERVEHVGVGRLLGLSLSPDARWLVMTVGSSIPRHGDVLPWQRVFVVPARSILKELDLKPADLAPGEVS